jgi:large subunit ribosomal protein L10
MLLTKQRKSEVLAELVELFKGSVSAVASDYSGLKTSDISDLRKSLKQKGIKLIVTKNSLVRKALVEAKLELESSILDKPVFFAFSEDEVEAAKILYEFGKKNENLQILGGIVNGKNADVAQIKMLALLPGKEELKAKLVGVLASPTYGLVNVLNANIRGLVSVISQYQQKIQS